MMSVSGLSLETATRRMGLVIEWALVVLVTRELIEDRAARSWVTRVDEGFIVPGEEKEEEGGWRWSSVLVDMVGGEGTR